MSRKGEVTLGIIGLVFSALGAIGGFIILALKNSSGFQESFDQAAATNPDVQSFDISSILDNFTIWAPISSIIIFIIALIAVIFVTGNKKPKAAGILFIVAAILELIFSGFSGIILTIIYLIPGIMCLVRKPQRMIEE